MVSKGPRKIWAVSAGSYSDYWVMCVCEDEPTAQRIADLCGEKDATVEEFAYYESGGVPKKVKKCTSRTVLHDNGTVSDGSYWETVMWDFETLDSLPPDRPVVRYSRPPILENKAGFMFVYGNSEESVAKVTHERISAFRSGQWIPQGENIKPRPA